METRANYVAIGIFVLAVIFGGFGFIYWLAKTGDNGVRRTVIIEFEGSVTGLGQGGLVLFNGIKIGEVQTLALNANDPTKVQAVASVDKTAPLKADTKAKLAYQGLTGVAHIEMEGGTSDAGPLFADDRVPVVKADRSAFQDLVDGAQTVLSRADKALSVIEELVVNNRDSIEKTIGNVEKFSGALAENSEGVDKFLAEVARAADTFASLSGKLEGLVEHADKLVVAVDPEKVGRVVDNVATFTDSLAAAADDVDGVVADFRKTAEKLSQFGDSLNETLARADKVIAAVDADKVGRVVDNVESITDGLAKRRDEIDRLIVDASSSAENINKLTARLAEREGDIDQIISEVKSATSRFNRFSGEINTAVADVRKLLAAVDTEQVGRVVDNVDRFTTRLGNRAGDLDLIIDNAKKASENVNSFTGNIAAKNADVDQIVADARQFSNRLNAVSVRIESLLAKVEGMVDSDGEGFITEATKAAQSIRKAADAFASRADTIAGGLERFSTRGVRDFEAMMNQGRQTLDTIERTFSDLDKNPNRVIFGGSNQPTYKRR
ncbi:MlaD family protein [Rhodobium gokarnense]|uniref:Phospholipid/cholesterol/gamma-HCH transport system substrate-binding protein n=1 Tax=Rhodobium gokarnense TaxID=364296 RepID=A0ABT3HIM7_9HYPH|nr:MlaD family protein [Rhodobium gokarnense]MCW2310258.1 phospholipid/cholesterol/gamma-HCH transport system substrate-binding protein [Rhodobium gokarnense]